MIATRSVAMAGICVLTALTTASGASAQTVRFALDWALQGHNSIWFLAEDLGCFEREGVTIQIDRGFGSGDTVTKVAGGAYEMGFADINPLIEFQAQNPGSGAIAVLMLNDNSATSIITLRETGIETPKDLAGRTIAGPLGDASRRLFPIFATANDIDESAIEWLNVSPELREPTLAQGEADAVTGHTFVAAIGLEALGVPPEDIVLLRYPEWGAELYGSAVMAKPDFAEANPEIVASVVKCTIEATQAAIADPAASIAALKRRDGLIDEAVELRRLQLALDGIIVTDVTREMGLGHVDAARLERTVEQAAAAFGVTAPPIDQLYTDDFLPPLDERRLD
jgi:NitT/TauT family transport system substrate-binding protein